MSTNQEAAIAALFQKSFGWGITIAMVGHTAVLLNVDYFGDKCPIHVGVSHVLQGGGVAPLTFVL